jgi:glyoxylase-like metal-dependent hydrolase (beta-lactamase superfamily II)
MSSAVEVAPGLHRWTAWHEEWEQEVGALALETDDGLVLVDPLEPPPNLRKPDHILLTVFWHGRSTGELGAKRVWAPARSVRRLHNRGVEVTDAFEAEPAELPGGVRAFETARDGEVVYWLPDQRAVAVGDVLLGAGAKPHATSEPLRLCPERWLGGKAELSDLQASLRPLLDLPLERVLVSHGEPVQSEGRHALAAVLT